MGLHGRVGADETRTAGTPMRFKEWLDKIEEAGGVKMTPGPGSNTDRSALYGLSAQYGHRGTQVPLSWGIDNKGTASLIAGVGGGIGAELNKSGFTVTAPPNLTKFPERNSKMVRNYSLPLQLPYLEGEDRPVVNTSNSTRNLFIKLGQVIQDKDPTKDSRVRQMDGGGNEQGKFKLPDMSDYTQIEQAKVFTRGLIHMVIANQLFAEGMMDKYDLQSPTVEAEGIRDGILICAISFKRLKDIPDGIGNGEEI
jgi:hypothetical protein